MLKPKFRAKGLLQVKIAVDIGGYGLGMTAPAILFVSRTALSSVLDVGVVDLRREFLVVCRGSDQGTIERPCQESCNLVLSTEFCP